MGAQNLVRKKEVQAPKYLILKVLIDLKRNDKLIAIVLNVGGKLDIYRPYVILESLSI